MTKEVSSMRERPPIVAVVGHIDHGKSTLLDYIRKSNTVATETGGITQHLSAYEAEHHSKASGTSHRITFLDTPGHEAFRAMRSRGLEVADVAILVVSAEDGVKPQTLEAAKLIHEAHIPYIVAFTKIDKPGADIEKAKMSLLEHGIYLEGQGGEIPFVAVSGKTGEGIPELLDLILLAAEMEGLAADTTLPGEGLVIEAHIDKKRGNTATLIVKNGSVQSGDFIVCEDSFAPVRIMENFLGKAITEALPGSPIGVIGFSTLPTVGGSWHIVKSKKEAETETNATRLSKPKTSTAMPASTESTEPSEDAPKLSLPVVIKTDFSGTGDAVVHELEKLPKSERLEVRVVNRSVGSITESDVRLVGSGKHPGIIVGFNVKVEKEARDLADRLGVEIALFDIIYALTAWLGEEIEKRRPRADVDERVGYARILKIFSATKGSIVLGGKVEEGALSQNEEVKIMRADVEVGRGTISSLQAQKAAAKKIESGSEFGAMIKTSVTIAAGDYLESFTVVSK